MRCFPCFSSSRNDDDFASPRNAVVESAAAQGTIKQKEVGNKTEDVSNTGAARHFNFRELAAATKNFRHECLLGDGGFGRVYKATLQSTNQVVAVKQLDRHGLLGNKEFIAEVQNLSQLRQPNLVNLVGYCADGDQRLLVYEYISGGSVEDHLLDSKTDKKPLDWITRMKIAHGAAQGLEYLHETAVPPVIYRDLKASNILLDDELNPKLSDFGLYKLRDVAADKMPLSCGVMGTYGHCAPEYVQGGHFTSLSDVYSFGVLLLELITGRRVVDTTRPVDEQNLVAWAETIFKDPKMFPTMADPLLNNQFSERGLNQAVGIAAMCLQEEPTARPLISDVMTALSFLSLSSDEAIPTAIPILSFRDKTMSMNSNANQRVTFVNGLGSSKHRDKDQKETREEVDLDYGYTSHSDSQGVQEDPETSDLRKSKSSEFGSSFGSRKGTDEKDNGSFSRTDSKNDSQSSSRYTGLDDDSSRFLSFSSNSQILKDNNEYDGNGATDKRVSSEHVTSD